MATKQFEMDDDAKILEYKKLFCKLNLNDEYDYQKKIINSLFVTISNKDKKADKLNNNYDKIDEEKSLKRIKIIINLIKVIILKPIILNDKFWMIISIIIPNIHILKNQLKYTYAEVPWEEIEFCLSIFLSSHLNPDDDNNIYYKMAVDEHFIIKHLEIFVRNLEKFAIYEIGKYKEKFLRINSDNKSLMTDKKQQITRENVKNILKLHWESYNELLKVFTRVRNIYSLKMIISYVCVAAEVKFNEAKTDIDSLVIFRTLLVMGEYLKNSTYSPNMSSDLIEMLVSLGSNYLADHIKSIRNNLAHTYLYYMRFQQESNYNVKIIEDFKRIHNALLKIMFKEKNNIVKDFLSKIESSNIDEFKNAIDGISTFDFKNINEYINVNVYSDIEKLIVDLTIAVKKQYINKSCYRPATSILSKVEGSIKQYSLAMSTAQHNLKCIFDLISEIIVISKRSKFSKIDFEKVRTSLRQSIQKYNPGQKNNLEVVSNHLRTLKYCIFNHSEFEVIDEHIDNLLRETLLTVILASRFQSIYYIKIEIDDNESNNIIEINRYLSNLESKVKHEYFYYEFSQRITEKKQLYELIKELKFEQKKVNNAAGLEYIVKLTEKISRYIDIRPFTIVELKNNFTAQFDQFFESIGNRNSYKKLLTHYKKNRSCKNELLKIDLLKFVDSLGISSNIISSNIKKTSNTKARDIKIQISKQNNIESYNQIIEKAINSLIVDEVELYKKDFQTTTKSLEIIIESLKEKAVETNNSILKVYKEDIKTKYAVEMLIMDVLNILDKENTVQHNKFSFDGFSPLLVARNLRNFLAHGGFLISLLPFDPDLAVIINAEKLIQISKKASFFKTSFAIGNQYMEDLDKVETVKQIKLDWIEKSSEAIKCIFDHISKLLNFQMHETIFDEALANKLRALIKKLQNDNNFYFPFNCELVDTLKNCTTIAELSNLLEVNKEEFLNEIFFLAIEENWIKAVENMIKMVDLNLDFKLGINLAIKLEKTSIAINILSNDKQKDSERIMETAAEYGNETVVKEILDKDPTQKLIYKLPKLIYKAIRGDHLSFVIFLLQKINSIKNNKSIIEKDYQLILYEAASIGNIITLENILKFLNDINADINKLINVRMTDDKQMTPLHIAVKNCHKDVAVHLIKNGASISNKTNFGWTPLHIVSTLDDVELIMELLKFCDDNTLNDITNAKCNALHLAAQYGHIGIVTALLLKNIKMNDKNNQEQTPIHIAVTYGHYKVLNILINHKNADLQIKTMYEKTIFHIAAENGNLKTIQSLSEKLKKTIYDEVTIEKWTPLHLAAYYGHLKSVSYLIPYSNINAKDKNGHTPLHKATLNGHLKVVKLLVSKFADINAFSNDLSTPLHFAVQKGHKEMVEYLIIADSNRKEQIKNNPLHYASQIGQYDIIKLLIEQNLNVNAENQDKWYPLHYAVKNNFYQCSKLLLLSGADITLQNNNKHTPVHIAASNGNEKIFKMFLKYKKEETNKICLRRDKQDHTPYHLAVINNHKSMIELIEKLVEKYKENNENEIDILKLTLQYNCISLFKNYFNLLKSNKTINIEEFFIKNSLIKLAVKYQNIEIIEENLIDYMTTMFDTFLFEAIQNGNLEMVKFFLKKSNEKMLSHKMPIENLDELKLGVQYSVQSKNLNTYEYLLKEGFKFHIDFQNQWNIYHFAAQQEHTHIFRNKKHVYYINNINKKTKEGFTFLHLAAMHPTDIIKLLKKGFTNIFTETDLEGRTALHLAVLFANLSNVKILIEKNIETLTIQDKNGLLPLHFSLLTDSNEILKIYQPFVKKTKTTKIESVKGKFLSKLNIFLTILAANKDLVNNKTNVGLTPLHLAAQSGFTEAVDALLKNKASPTHLTLDGKSAFDLAVKNGHINIAQKLFKLK